MPPRFIARQLSCPAGFLGGVIGLLMNRHNAKMNRFVVRQLQLAPTDHVLEIGFGGGVNLGSLIAGTAFTVGVDPSQGMVRRAKARFAEEVSAGRADFRVCSVDELPFESSSFDKVCTVNTIYFWKSLHSGFAQIHRVLSPGGCLIVGFLPKRHMDRMGMPTDIFTSRTPEEVEVALKSAGFIEVRVERPKPTTPWNVMISRRDGGIDPHPKRVGSKNVVFEICR